MGSGGGRRRRRWLGAVLAIMAIALAGCVDYETTLRFWDANHGEIVQRVRLDDRVGALGDVAAAPWLDGLRERTQRLGGAVRSRSARELDLSIPVANGEDLVEKLRALLDGVLGPAGADGSVGVPPESIEVALLQRNYGVVVRNELSLGADLRSLVSLAIDRQVVVGAEGLVRPRVVVAAPVIAVLEATGAVGRTGGAVVWPLQLGVVNRLVVVFWVPSWLGVGAIVIALVCALGWWWAGPGHTTPAPEGNESPSP